MKEDPTSSPSPTSSATVESRGELAPVRKSEAVEALKRGTRQLAESPYVGFVHSITALATPIVTTDGTWVPLRRWRSTTTAEDPSTGERSVMHAVSVGPKTWMQMESWTGDDAGCWLSMSGTQVPLGISGLVPGVPGYFSVLPYLKPRGFDPADPSLIVAEVRLDYAAVLFPVPVAQVIQDEVEQPSQSRVEVTISVGRDGIEGYALTGGALLSAVLEAASEESSALSDVGISTTDFRVEFSLDGAAPQSITAPPEELSAEASEGGCR